ncbi:MAG: RNA methyltransferase [Prolixibacteraceae bacterium]
MIQLPDSFETRMKKMLGPEYPDFNQSLTSEISHSVRINRKKSKKNLSLNPVPYCNSGFYLPKRPIYTLDPLFHAGVYYVQESSSMFLEQFFCRRSRNKLRVLDLCAAPGGKSTHLSSFLSDDCLLVSNEVIHSRARILSENLKKWGNPNVVVTCNDPADFARLPGFFDVIVVDAPCSGEGLFRRDPSAMNEWSESNADHCAQRQKRILADVWSSLAEDGMLIYSTCTYNPAENEDNITWLSQFATVEAVTLEIPDEWGVVTTDANGLPCYRFYPHKGKGEGYFTSAVIKKGKEEKKWSAKNKTSLPLAGKADQKLISGFLQNDSLSLLQFEDSFLAWPTEFLTELDQIKAALRIVHAGVKTGEIVRDSFNPAHELAISTICNQSSFQQTDLSLEQALSYLKRDDFQAYFREKGWNLVCWLGQPLGWAKNIGNRFNNGYPKEWRIRMSITEYTGERLAEEAEKFPLNK